MARVVVKAYGATEKMIGPHTIQRQARLQTRLSSDKIPVVYLETGQYIQDPFYGEVNLVGVGFMCTSGTSKEWAIEIIVPTKGKVKTMLKSMSEDLVKFVKEHREVIYIIGSIAVLDQLLFHGAFRERLKGIVEGFLKKAEDKLKAKEGE